MAKENRIIFKEIPGSGMERSSDVNPDELFTSTSYWNPSRAALDLWISSKAQTVLDEKKEIGLPTSQEVVDLQQESQTLRQDLADEVLPANDGVVSKVVETDILGKEVLKTLGLLGISEDKYNEIVNDDTNPYALWFFDFLADFSSKGLIFKPYTIGKDIHYRFESKNGSASSISRTFDIAMMWKSHIAPVVLKSIGGKDNYKKYRKMIEIAIHHGAPSMKKLIDFVCYDKKTDISFVANTYSLIKIELDKMLSGWTIADLNNEQEQLQRLARQQEDDNEREERVGAQEETISEDVGQERLNQDFHRTVSELEDMMESIKDIAEDGDYSAYYPARDNAMSHIMDLMDETRLLLGESFIPFHEKVKTILSSGGGYDAIHNELDQAFSLLGDDQLADYGFYGSLIQNYKDLRDDDFLPLY